MTVCFIMSRTSSRVNPQSIVCMSVKELLARSSRHIWRLSDIRATRFEPTTTPSKHLLVFKTSSRHVLKKSLISLQRNNFSSSMTSWRCLENILKTSCKTSWRRLGRRKIIALKRYWSRLEDMSWRRLEDISWRCLRTSWRQTKCFLKLSVSNKSKCVSNKSGISQIYIWRI